jgi:replicative DNA helicase
MTATRKVDEGAWRQAPHNIEAEQALLGAILVNNEAHDRVASFLDPHHFYDPLHGQIYDVLSKLIAAGKQATPITLRTYFETAAPIDATTTVPVYLGRLGVNATTIINAREYGRTIQDLFTRRQLIVIGEDVVNNAFDSTVDLPPKAQIEEAEMRLFSLAEHGRDSSHEVSASVMQGSAMAAIEAAYKNKGALAGLSTGLRDVDAKSRLQAGHLIIIAGRPSMGKTALATKIVRAQEVPVHFFSMEMSAEQIGHRLLSEETGIPGDQLRRGDLDEVQWRLVLAATKKLGRQHLIVDPTGGLTIGQIAAHARRTKRKQGTGLIVVDYLQLAHGTKRFENRTQEVSEITMGLKALAKELQVPVLALSQLSRDVEKREDKRPQLADLRDSGSIEQDADLVLLLYREEYYVEREKPAAGQPQRLADWMQKIALAAGKAEVIVAKNRHGAIGTVQVHFNAAITRFSDLAFSDESAVNSKGP